MSLTPQEKRLFVSQLEKTRSTIATFYKYFLCVLIAGVTILLLLLRRSWQGDASKDFLTFYFGVLYLIFLAWAIGQIVVLKRREKVALEATTPAPPISFANEKDPESGVRHLRFQIGTPPADPSSGYSFRFGAHVSSLAEEDCPDSTALEQAEFLLAEGADLETACWHVCPKYGAWGEPERQIYKAALQGELALRRAPAAERAGSGAAGYATPGAEAQPHPETASNTDRPVRNFQAYIIAALVLGALLMLLWGFWIFQRMQEVRQP